ncbi:hypothetical protein BDZ94DRAFT_1262758 [Collybia nuda]|uniref:Uncharacterized protein n=1 Tax=Collybia nuda TaxID=64659 RepID=A0A9P6CDI7_9AGAR|nr:hypothetical protein BDZ94DRAFT_1262758 [Collybia nuda]
MFTFIKTTRHIFLYTKTFQAAPFNAWLQYEQGDVQNTAVPMTLNLFEDHPRNTATLHSSSLIFIEGTIIPRIICIADVWPPCVWDSEHVERVLFFPPPGSSQLSRGRPGSPPRWVHAQAFLEVQKRHMPDRSMDVLVLNLVVP